MIDSIEETDTGKTIWLIVCAVSMGGFLFGYDTGVIPAVLINMGSDLGKPLSSNEQELVTSITSGGALIGSVVAGMTADKYGAKLAIYVGCIIFFIGSIIQATAYSLAKLTVGRLVVGFGVGEAAMIVPLYIGEMAPARFRGRLIFFDNFCVTFGQLISYALGAAFTIVASGWRYMVGLGAIPALLLIAMMPLCPETPRQLLLHAKIFPQVTDQQADAKAILIRHSLEETIASISDKSLLWQMRQLFTVCPSVQALITACAVMAVSQLGSNTIIYYSTTLFSIVGFDKPTVVSIVVGAINLIIGFPNFIFIYRFGRRRMLLVTILGMASLPLVVASVAFHWIPINHNLTVTMMNSVTCWRCNIIISSTFLSMMKGMTPSGAFGFYAGIGFLRFIFAVFCYPEVP
ncbi:hypothetical protein BDV29DRAFT_199507 [Aspergillus leporis]|uniref:Major facilitator superfamily (MFS) profile domain-containing protein n=1 Tax=Aspergillus leporis TaxID=41062 RepID=A0A5N5WJ12_9EURO|nr:hypothetical protein BDV29DRAFT_199507 [Aspergillus leporis]